MNNFSVTTSPVSSDLRARLNSSTLEEFPGSPSSNHNGSVSPLNSHYQRPLSSLQYPHPPQSSRSTIPTLASTPASAELEANVITSSSSVVMTANETSINGDDDDAQKNHPGRQRSTSKATLADTLPNPDIIPTAIVIKNIPFAMKRDHLISLLDDLAAPQPYALNYHFENGAFRGLAFANFRTGVEADIVVSRLDNYEIMGRKIKVEYKKVLPPEEAARKEAERRASIAALNDRVMEFNLSDPATRQLYDKMATFRDDKLRNELIFAKSITGPERKLVRAIGQKLGFFYRTEDNGEERFFKVTRRSTLNINKVNLKELELDHIPRKYSLSSQIHPDIMQFPSAPSLPSISNIPSSVVGTTAERFITRGTRSLSLSAHDVPAFSRSLRKNSLLSQTPPPGFNALRQPKGPDTGQNFSNTVGRKSNLNPIALPLDTAQMEATVARSGTISGVQLM